MIKAEDLRVGDLVYVNRSNMLPYESVCTISWHTSRNKLWSGMCQPKTYYK